MQNKDLFELIRKDGIVSVITESLHPIDFGEGEVKLQMQKTLEELTKLKEVLISNGMEEDIDFI